MGQIKLNDVVAPAFHPLFKPFFQEEVDEFVLKGGRGSTKSSFAGLCIPFGMMMDYHEKGLLTNAICLRKVANTCKTSVYEQVVWALDKLGCTDDWHVTVSPLRAVYKPSGQEILFKGCDDPTKIKSIKFSKGYCKYIWFEEINEFKDIKETRNVLQSLARGGKNLVLFSYNPPPSKNNWANWEFSKVKNYRLIHHSTYLDVPKHWLGDYFIRVAEDLKAENYKAYENEYLGLCVGLGGEIFYNVQDVTLLDDDIWRYDKIRNGLDFGYEEPTAFNHFHFDNREIVMLDEIYERRLHMQPLSEKINNIISFNELMRADSASPGNIAELKLLGLNIKGAKKPPGSRDRGMKYLQSLKSIKIDRKRTPKTYWEFTTYEKKVDKFGEFIDEYPKENDHSIDAVRYGLSDLINMTGWKYPKSKGGIY